MLGAGCSLEPPTSLKLADEYAREAHRSLVADGVLEEGDCEDPSDLSLLASAVYEKRGRQSELVEKLPIAAFRLAQANDGYRIAAALLEEGAVGSVMTLNFDLAMTNALGWAGAHSVTEVPGPQALQRLGAKSVIYLHRNAEELDTERWILRVEALATEWQGQWEQLIANRVMASPVVVFVGLGSPAAVLTDTARRLAAISEDLVALVVDPAPTSTFLADLSLEADRHIRAKWCDFMHHLGDRVLAEIRADLERVCRELRDENGWADDDASVSSLCDRYESLGILDAGELRSRWLSETRIYSPDDDRRHLVADVLLAMGVVESATGAVAGFAKDGVVTFSRPDGSQGRVLGLSGLGRARWSSIEPRISDLIARLPADRVPQAVLVGAVTGPPRTDLTPPRDLVVGDDDDSILDPHDSPTVASIDDLRADPAIAHGWVA